MMKEIQEIINFIKEKDNFLLATHIKYDPDALGSLFGIALILEKLNKNFLIYFREELDKKFSFLPLKEKIIANLQDLSTKPNIVIMDCENISRVGESLYSYIKKNNLFTILIDHHKTNERDANLNLVLDFNSTSEIIYLIAKELNIEFDSELSTVLLLGILGDTLVFTIETTKEKMINSLETVKDLVLKEGDYNFIVNVLLNKNFEEFKNNLNILNNAVFEDGIVWLVIDKNDVEGIANSLNRIKDAKVAVVFKILEGNRTKVSLRSKGGIDVSYLAKEYFNGGGHKNAAGGILNMDIESAKIFVLEKVKEYLKNVN